MLATKAKIATLRTLIFSVGELYLAVRLEGVKKVIPMPKIFKSGNKLLGITQADNQEVIVVDLYQRIYGQSATQTHGFLIVVQAENTLYGITAEVLPTMREIPLTEFHPVPPDYRDRDSLGIAEQMVQVTLDNKQVVTAFLLDPAHLRDLMSLSGSTPKAADPILSPTTDELAVAVQASFDQLGISPIDLG
jgi:chemotaxis signal transduction protein